MIEPFTPKQSMQILHTVFGPFLRQEQGEFVQQSRAPSVADDFPLFSWPKCYIQGWNYARKLHATHLLGLNG